MIPTKQSTVSRCFSSNKSASLCLQTDGEGVHQAPGQDHPLLHDGAGPGNDDEGLRGVEEVPAEGAQARPVQQDKKPADR